MEEYCAVSFSTFNPRSCFVECSHRFSKKRAFSLRDAPLTDLRDPTAPAGMKTAIQWITLLPKLRMLMTVCTSTWHCENKIVLETFKSNYTVFRNPRARDAHPSKTCECECSQKFARAQTWFVQHTHTTCDIGLKSFEIDEQSKTQAWQQKRIGRPCVAISLSRGPDPRNRRSRRSMIYNVASRDQGEVWCILLLQGKQLRRSMIYTVASGKTVYFLTFVWARERRERGRKTSFSTHQERTFVGNGWVFFCKSEVDERGSSLTSQIRNRFEHEITIKRTLSFDQ